MHRKYIMYRPFMGHPWGSVLEVSIYAPSTPLLPVVTNR